MPDCKKLDPFVTPYVDGELAAADRADVDAHLRVCPPCHARVVIEQSVRDLLSARKQALKHECASASLRSRCTQAASARLRARATPGDGEPTSAVHGLNHAGTWRGRVRPLALAASLV